MSLWNWLCSYTYDWKAIATIGGAVLVVGSIPITQAMIHGYNLKRERRAELRKALAEFGAAASSAVIQHRAKITVANFLLHKKLQLRLAKQRPDAKFPGGVARLSELQSEVSYWQNLTNETARALVAADLRFSEARCRVRLLEIDESHSIHTEEMAEQLLDREIRVGDRPRNIGEGRGRYRAHRDAVRSWLSMQAARTDL